MNRPPKNRAPCYRARKPRPTLKAIVEHRPPNPGRTRGGLGWEYVYPSPPHEHHEAPDPCDPPAPYDAATPGPVWDGEGP